MSSSKYAQSLRRIILRRSCSASGPSNRLWAGRCYHSYEHDRAPPFTEAENAILSAGLTHVPTQGFSNNALTSGARDVGYRDVSVNLFPAGAFALVQYHLVTQRLALVDTKELDIDHGLGVAANIERLALRRLHANKTIVHRWQEVSNQWPDSSKARVNCTGTCSHGYAIPFLRFPTRARTSVR